MVTSSSRSIVFPVSVHFVTESGSTNRSQLRLRFGWQINTLTQCKRRLDATTAAHLQPAADQYTAACDRAVPRWERCSTFLLAPLKQHSVCRQRTGTFVCLRAYVSTTERKCMLAFQGPERLQYVNVSANRENMRVWICLALGIDIFVT